MVYVQLNTILPPHPSHNTPFVFQSNINQFQSHTLNGANHHSSILVEGLFSSKPLVMIPTPIFPNSYKAEDTNEFKKDFVSAGSPVNFAPNNTKTEGMMNSYPENSMNLQDFSQKNPPGFGMIFKPRMGPSSSPSLLYDANACAPVNLKFRDESSCILGTGGHLRGTDQSLLSEEQQNSVKRRKSKNGDEDMNIVKGQWTAEEDRVLIELVKEYGSKLWAKIARFVKCRTGKQCRDRWSNHLRPNIMKGPWIEEEEQLLIDAHEIFGNQWTKIAKRLPWRTENSIKNHWNTTKRRLKAKKKQGTHNDGSNRTLLSNYVMQFIANEGDAKKMKKPTSAMTRHSEQEESHKDIGSVNASHESLKGDFSSKCWATQEDEVSGSGIMDYKLGLEMLLDDPMKKEKDFLDMIYLNP